MMGHSILGRLAVIVAGLILAMQGSDALGQLLGVSADFPRVDFAVFLSNRASAVVLAFIILGWGAAIQGHARAMQWVAVGCIAVATVFFFVLTVTAFVEVPRMLVFDTDQNFPGGALQLRLMVSALAVSGGLTAWAAALRRTWMTGASEVVATP